jgi:hypothetical protein
MRLLDEVIEAGGLASMSSFEEGAEGRNWREEVSRSSSQLTRQKMRNRATTINEAQPLRMPFRPSSGTFKLCIWSAAACL